MEIGTAAGGTSNGTSVGINTPLVNQLDSGSKWYTSTGATATTISYGFTTSSSFASGFGEATGWSAFTEGHVTAEGRMSACCFDATANWTMGDLNKVSFMEAWNSPEFVNLRAAHLRKDVRGTVCENCIAYG